MCIIIISRKICGFLRKFIVLSQTNQISVKFSELKHIWRWIEKAPIPFSNIFISSSPIDEIFIVERKVHKFFSAKKFDWNFYHRRNFCQNVIFRGFKNAKKWPMIHKSMATPMKSWHMCPTISKALKSICLQFGRFRWPESADLIKSENFIFFDFLRSILIHFMHCKFHEYWKMLQIYNAEKDDFWWILHTFPLLFIHFHTS